MAPKQMNVTMEFNLPARIRKKRGWYVASCLPLDVHSQGHTRAEAEENLVDALTAFFVSCYERETLDTVLREAGFTPVVEAGDSRVRIGRDTVWVTVPVPFVISSRAGRVAAVA